jgi:5-methylthioadenosine/S-adenosylhomocysteine deaminase
MTLASTGSAATWTTSSSSSKGCSFPDRLLIRDGHVLTLDRSLGDFERADILIEDGRISAIQPGLAAGACEVLEAAGKIVLPGFVDTHRHTWQTAMRAICADWTLLDYFRGIRLNISTAYRPEDVYAGNYVGALEALDAGVTTILDFSHCLNTPAHADEAVRGLHDAGIRAIFAYGFYPVPLEEPVFTSHDLRLEDAGRVRAEHLPGDGQILGMGVALTELGLIPYEDTRRELETARELGVLVTAHIGTVRDESWPREIEILQAADLLGPGQVHVHCNACTGAELGLIAAAGASVSVTPETEMQMGMGFPITGRALAAGLRPTLGCDVISNNSGDLFTQMRLALQMQRALDNEEQLERMEMPRDLGLSVRDVLEFGTIDGADALGLGARVGSLTPGKEADLVILRTDGLNFAPLNDPAGSIVLQAGRGDVDTVLVAGRVVKRDGRLLGVDLSRARRLVEESRDHIIGAVAARGGLMLEMPEGWFEAVRAAAVENLATAPRPSEV